VILLGSEVDSNKILEELKDVEGKIPQSLREYVHRLLEGLNELSETSDNDVERIWGLSSEISDVSEHLLHLKYLSMIMSKEDLEKIFKEGTIQELSQLVDQVLLITSMKLRRAADHIPNHFLKELYRFKSRRLENLPSLIRAELKQKGPG